MDKRPYEKCLITMYCTQMNAVKINLVIDNGVFISQISQQTLMEQAEH
jgi:hypothetical protein